MNKTGLLAWRSHDNGQVAHAPIFHVAVAVADTDETYGAYAAAEDDTNNTRNNDYHANHRNDDGDDDDDDDDGDDDDISPGDD